jgi:hypothetical protein
LLELGLSIMLKVVIQTLQQIPYSFKLWDLLHWIFLISSAVDSTAEILQQGLMIYWNNHCFRKSVRYRSREFEQGAINFNLIEEERDYLFAWEDLFKEIVFISNDSDVIWTFNRTWWLSRPFLNWYCWSRKNILWNCSNIYSDN